MGVPEIITLAVPTTFEVVIDKVFDALLVTKLKNGAPAIIPVTEIVFATAKAVISVLVFNSVARAVAT